MVLYVKLFYKDPLEVCSDSSNFYEKDMLRNRGPSLSTEWEGKLTQDHLLKYKTFLR